MNHDLCASPERWPAGDLVAHRIQAFSLSLFRKLGSSSSPAVAQKQRSEFSNFKPERSKLSAVLRIVRVMWGYISEVNGERFILERKWNRGYDTGAICTNSSSHQSYRGSRLLWVLLVGKLNCLQVNYGWTRSGSLLLHTSCSRSS